MNAIFVGCNPSLKNTDVRVPFEGTRSGVVLVEWLKILGLSRDSYRLLNLTDMATKSQTQLKKSDINLLDFHYQLAFTYFSTWIDFPKVVALGTLPSWALKKLEIEHFALPHPSGLNRKLNDKTFVKEQLQQCKKYLKDSSISGLAKQSV